MQSFILSDADYFALLMCMDVWFAVNLGAIYGRNDRHKLKTLTQCYAQ